MNFSILFIEFLLIGCKLFSDRYESKEMSEKAMDILSNNSIIQVQQWKDANPDYQHSPEKNIEFLKMVKNISGGYSESEERDNKKKIIRNLSKNTHLNKEKIAHITTSA